MHPVIQSRLKPAVITVLISRPFKIVAGLFVVYLLLGYFAVNPLAKRILPWVAENKLASRMTVDQVKFDPLRLILRVDNLRLSTQAGAPLAGFEGLQVNLETTGLFRFAWRLHDIRLTGPQVVFDIAPDGKLNWAELIAKLNEEPEPPSDGMTRLLIDHILIENGHVQYSDRNRPTAFRMALKPLGLELDGLSTLPEDRGDYLIAAKLPEQGGTLKWKGDIALNPVASKGVLELQGIQLAKLLQVVDPGSLPVQVTGGALQTRLNYDFSMTSDTAEPLPQARLSDIDIQLSQLAARLNPQASITLDETTLKLPALDFSMRGGAQVRFQGLTLSTKGLALRSHEKSLFSLPQASIAGVDFDLAGKQLKVAEVTLQGGEIHAARSRDGAVNFSELAPVTAKAESAPASDSEPAQPFRFEVSAVKLQDWKADYIDSGFVRPLRVAVGDIDLGLALDNRDGALAIRGLNAEWSQIALYSADDPQASATLAKLTANDGEVRLQDQQISLSSFMLSGLDTQVKRGADGRLNWQSLLEQHVSSVSSGPASATTRPVSKTSEASPWKLDLGRIGLDNGSVHYSDSSTPSPVTLDLQQMSLELQQATLDLAKPIPLKAKLRIKQGGQLNVSGRLAPSPLSTDLQVHLQGLSLKPFTPYVNQAAYLKLDDGRVNLNGKLALRSAKSLQGGFNGGFSIERLQINEEQGGATFLAWKEVSSDSLRLDIGKPQLHMDALRIVEPVGKFIIYEDRTLNVKRILRPAAPANPPVAAKTPSSAAESSFDVSVDRISIDNASMEFADLSLKPQFGTNIHSLGGVINGLSSSASSTAQVELDGKVDEFGSARIRGSVQPFRATEFTDLKLAFHNLEMANMTPYSGKFAGRKIDSGKLSVDLEYKIKQRQLAGDNKFVINKLKLGERVDSPDAANLPLDLAIALLEDKDGLIDLDLPVTGNLDDPQFSYGKIVWKAIVNVIGKIVTSPFRALGKLLGISSDKLEAVLFEPGMAVLAPQEQEKLKAIGSILEKRPALALKVSPTVDPVADLAALQEQATRRDVLKEMGVKLKEGEQPGPIDLNNPKAQVAIESLLKERQGKGSSLKAVNKLKAYFKKSSPEDLPQYSEMLAQLTLTAQVSEADVTALGKARAAAMQRYLLETAGLPAARISQGEASKVQGDGKAVAVKMELGVSQ